MAKLKLPGFIHKVSPANFIAGTILGASTFAALSKMDNDNAPKPAPIAYPQPIPAPAPLPIPPPPALCQMQDGYRMFVNVTADTKDKVSVTFGMAVRVKTRLIEDWSRHSKLTHDIVAKVATDIAEQQVGNYTFFDLDAESRIRATANSMSRAKDEPLHISIRPPEDFTAQLEKAIETPYSKAMWAANKIESRPVEPFTITIEDGIITTAKSFARDDIKDMAKKQKDAAARKYREMKRQRLLDR